MFGREEMELRISNLEHLVEKLLKKDLPKESKYLQTDPIQYTDPLGNKGSYRRVGNRIEFTAEYPPKGINIKTDTLTRYGRNSTAEVIGWETNTVIMK